MKKYLLITTLIIATSTAAFANHTQEIKLLNEAKITLTQAIATAEKHQSGKAIDAGIDDDHFKPVYKVSIVKDNKVFDVQVDGLTNKVLGVREDVD
ncbi:MAG: Propeptide, PepSY amd peptidase [Rickettsiaceae bacterium]|nr:Propeptide, PepSY amd peptidase [Rickettsiaceae bacterium]